MRTIFAHAFTGRNTRQMGFTIGGYPRPYNIWYIIYLTIQAITQIVLTHYEHTALNKYQIGPATKNENLLFSLEKYLQKIERFCCIDLNCVHQRSFQFYLHFPPPLLPSLLW